MKKVRIKLLRSGVNGEKLNWNRPINEFSKPEISVKKTLQPVDKEDANVEAEKGETIVSDMNFDGISEHYKIAGEKHSNGGTPLNVPSDSFIFSDSKKMKIKDDSILKLFGKSGKKEYTPADISKAYDINDYSKALADPDSDSLQRKTAEAMIANYNLKLAKLALAQESMKGFPTGIPKIAMPYIESSQVNPSDFFSTQAQQEQSAPNTAQYGGELLDQMEQGGSIPNNYVYPKYGTQVHDYFSNNPTIETKRRTKEYEYDAPVYQSGGDIHVVDINDPQLKVGDYVKDANGRIKKVTSLPVRTNFKDDRLGNLQNEFGYLSETLKDPNLQNKLFDNYKQHIQNSNLPKSRKDQLLSKPKEEVIGNFLNAQKQVYAIHDKKTDLTSNQATKWDTGTKNSVYKNSIKNLGFKDNEVLNDDQVAMFQAAYKGLLDVSQDPSFKDKLDKFGTPVQGGMSDEPLYKGQKNISPVDDWFGNTTAGQALLPRNIGPELQDVEPQAAAAPGKEKPTAAPLLATGKVPSQAQWWLQDIVKTAGAAGDFFRIKKYNPWQANPGYTLPSPTFYDPNRELAANAEQMNIMSQGLSTFNNPQAYLSGMSSVAGNAAKNSADILGRYNNLNVGVANQFEQGNSDIINQNTAQTAALNTQLYDKYTITNQQFDNSKNMARQGLRQSFIDAITNKNYTANLNDLYPQYNINPIVGGRIKFTKGSPLDPSVADQPDVMDIAQDYLSRFPSFDPKTAYEAAKLKATGKVPPQGSIPPEYLDMLDRMR